jgi:hypothetical protein
VTLTCQKADTNDLILEDWKRYLDLTEKAIFESELSDYDWYSVVENQKVIAVFQIIKVKRVKYAKNLKIIFHPDFKNDENDIVEIILFIYKSMLFICSGEKIKKLKLYIDDLLIHSIFMVIAKHQAGNKDIIKVENYRKWIEIHMY